MENYNFSEPTRQSIKGIIIIVLITLGKRLKQYAILFVYVFFQWYKKTELAHTYGVYVVVGLCFLLTFWIVRGILVYKNFTFLFKENQFYLHQGIFNKSKTVIPKSKIQNIHISQSFIQQLLNVVQVTIDSSGDEGDEVEIKALSKPKALALKKLLLDRKEQKTEDRSNDAILVKLNFIDLLLVGITENHFRNLMIIIVAIVSFYHDIKDLLTEFGTTIDSQFISLFFDNNLFLGSTLIILFLLISGLLYSILTTLILNFNFSIRKKREAFVITKGIFNKTEFTVQLDKIQSVAYVTNFFKSRFGLYTVRLFQTATEFKTQKKRELIGLKNEDLRALENYIFKLSPIKKLVKNKPHVYYLRQLSLRAFIIVALFNIYILVLPSLPYLFFLNFLIIPYVAFMAYLKWKKCYYYFDADYFVFGSGGIDTVTSIIEIHNVQSVRTTQTYFQKKHKLFNLHLATASNKFKIPCIEEQEVVKLTNYLLYKIESSELAWQ